ncbi:unnamed protein product [Bursaphelenchus okinawaensis]|uniref:BAG domain-containing protein n=1 Tax=Bursaphelenchus okinawaensis TaxID=465554 RepID=A0A811L6M0_9BILA|nr:unnamed protein product [Bursaphelenchus okinawaensis]CAG9119159.1 unnamed protein product [Bursaphelenchus okinawaensis]
MDENKDWENGRGLPRSFADDPFFQQHHRHPSGEFFRDFPQNPGPTRRFGSNPRLFPEPNDRFFDDFDNNYGSLPRRSPRPPSVASERTIPVNRPGNLPHGPTQRGPSPNLWKDEAIPAPAPPPKPQQATPPQKTQATARAPSPQPQVHVINVHPSKPEGIVEINNTGTSSYTNGALNPDRTKMENINVEKVKPVEKAEKEEIVEKKSEPEKPEEKAAEAVVPDPEPAKEPVKEVREKPKFSRKTSVDGCSEKLYSLLDDTEIRVEKLRETAAQLEAEKESLLEIINSLKVNTEILKLDENDQEDINATTERILKRCRAVDVVVNTPRNEEQTRALEEVNKLIAGVVDKMNENLAFSKDAIERFLNACSPDEPNGPIDQKFQSKVVECTADDQKKIRRRLAQLISKIDRAERTVAVEQ